MSVVVLAEKPSQAKAYAEAFTVKNRDRTKIELKSCETFPNGAIITWGIGHLVSLKLPNEYKEEWKKWDLKNLPIIPETFEFKVSPDKKAQFKTVKKLFQEAHTIINACDIDREGSNIFYSILDMTGIKNKTIKRLWVNTLEADEIKKGFNNLKDNKKDLLMYQEAQTRQLSDWLVGMNASQLYSLHLQQKGFSGSFSVGRVQSPTLYMIYQRQQEIENFQSKPFYELQARITHAQGNYHGKAKIREENREVILELLAENQLSLDTEMKGFIKDVSKTLKKQKSPRLHSLSTLQTKANKNWKYSPAKVLTIMQSLYEKKVVTYPRTDSNYITDSEFKYLSDQVERYQALLNVSFDADKEKKKRYVDNKKVVEHYAIVPTKTIPSEQTLSALSIEEKHIYEEILKTTLAMFHQDYEYEETAITTSVKGIDFFTTGKIELNQGWKGLFLSENKQTANSLKSDDPLPNVQENDHVGSFLSIKKGQTEPPKPYTEGGLINLMKTAGKSVTEKTESDILKAVEGIGTEATRSGIIETIKKNDYITVKNNIVTVTDKGIILCRAIEGSLLSSPSMTAKWEKYLAKIGNGEGSKEIFLKNIHSFLYSLIEKAPESLIALANEIEHVQNAASLGVCLICGDGRMSDKGKFYGCSNYQNGCKFTLPKRFAGKNLSESNIKLLLNNKKTPLIKEFKSKKGSTFNAHLKIDPKTNKLSFEFKK